MASKQNDLPLHTVQTEPYVWFNRFHFVFYTCALFALFSNRLSSLIHSKSLLSFISFYLITLADLIFALTWILAQAFRWNPVRRRSFPENLRAKLTDRELPTIDIFICTADPDKEPPINVANTALSVMAFDYPLDKISVYLSDDGWSKLTLFAFMEAARFAKHWIPFCKEHNIRERNPKAYFSSISDDGYKTQQSSEVKLMYEAMKERVDVAVEIMGAVSEEDAINEQHCEAFTKWTDGFTRTEHSAVVEVLLSADKDLDVSGHAMPNLVYVSRGKSKEVHPHFKAGALNALLRVSSVMSNAPIVMNLDCDMYSNDPMVPHRALCFLLDPEQEPDLAFVQFPQIFPNVNKDDIYGNEYKQVFQIVPLGMDGSRGPNYVGTGCFFRRRAFAGKPSLPPHPEIVLQDDAENNGATERIWSKATMEKAHHVAGWNYEQGTEWGSTIGFRYGSLVEDFYTGYLLHCEGWRSVFCHPKERGPCFVGDFPVSLNGMLDQCRRWCLGLLEVVFSSGKCPLTYGLRRTSFINALCCARSCFWPFWGIPIMIYALLPQFTMLLSLSLYPKTSDPWIYLYIYLFLGAYGQEMLEFMREGGTFTRWWNDQRMWSIRGVTSIPLGLLDYLLQHLGIAVSGFNVTSKVSEDQVAKRYEQGLFEFGVESPYFFAISAIAVISLIAFVVGLARAVLQGSLEHMLVQLFISGFVVANSWPVYEAMVLRSDSGRMPTKISGLAGLAGCGFFLVAETARAFIC